MTTIQLNFVGQETPQQIHKYLAKLFTFPDYYGHNLDALYDMLTDISEDTCIVIRKANSLSTDSYIQKVLNVLYNAASYNKHIILSDKVKNE